MDVVVAASEKIDNKVGTFQILLFQGEKVVA
jgi:hypothetical protein